MATIRESHEIVIGSKDVARLSDVLDTEVKGPDPAVWGDDSERPSTNVVLPVPVDDAGEPMEVKGPDPEVWGT